MKYKSFLLFRAALVLCVGIGVFSYEPSVQAGGFELNEEGSSQKDSVEIRPSSLQDQREPSSQLLNWKDWSQPYIDRDNVCRENNGNIVCLSAESARYMHWRSN